MTNTNTLHLVVPLEPAALSELAGKLAIIAGALQGERGDKIRADFQAEADEGGRITHEATAHPESLDTVVDEDPAPAPAPTETQAAAPAPAATETHIAEGVELDGEGLPWDARIHSSSKAKLAKKPHSWKVKRGTDPELVESVKAELRAAMAVPAGSTTASAADESDAASMFGSGADGGAAPAPAATEAQAAAPAPGAAPQWVATPTDFPSFMAAVVDHNIPTEKVTEAVNSAGLVSATLLAARSDLIPQVWKALQA